MYFEVNLPADAPHLTKQTRRQYRAVSERIRSRMEKLETALEMSGLSGGAFSLCARPFFSVSEPEYFDAMSAERLTTAVNAVYTGKEPAARLEWPGAETVFDCAFVAQSEWELVRRLGIGGSDAAVLINCSRYRTAENLFQDKTGAAQLPPNPEQAAVFARGHVLESEVIQAFCRVSGAIQIPESRMFRSRTFPACTANPDAVIRMPDGGIYILEAKTTVAENRGAWMGGHIPVHYIPQTRQYPAVLNDERIRGTYIACLFVQDMTFSGSYLGSSFNREQVTFRLVERSRAMEDDQLQSQQAWWDAYVKLGILPPHVSQTGSKTMKVSTEPSHDVQKEKFRQIPYIGAFRDTVDSYLEAKQQQKTHETAAGKAREAAEHYAEEIRRELKDASAGYVDLDPSGDYLDIRWISTEGRETPDLEKLRAKYPSVYADILKKGTPKRRFTAVRRAKSGPAWKAYRKKHAVV